MSASGTALRAPAARRRPARDLRVVNRREKSGWRKWAPIAAIVTIVVGMVILGVLLEQVTLAQSAFRLSHLRDELLHEEARHEELLLEAAKLGSPDRIEMHARTRLGMVDPPSIEYIVADVYGGTARRFARGPQRVALPADPSMTAAAPVAGGP